MTASPDAIAAFERRKRIVVEHLRSDARRLAQELVPRGRAHGHTWSAYPPHRDSDNASAFAIYISGPKAGGWIDFVTDERGDALGLIMLVKGLDFKEALEWAEGRYGLRHLTPERQAELTREVERRQKIFDAREEEERQKRIRRACHMFSQAEADIEGTLVDRYLLSRGIDLRALPNRDARWLRFLPRATYWMLPDRPQLPAMIAGMVDAAGQMRACHLTFLRGDGRGKADVPKAKLMWPETKGLVIRLNHGRGGLDPEAAFAAGQAAPLALGEGIEDGLSLAMGEPDLRVWAASSLSNLLNVPDLPSTSAYLVAQDNDWGKAAAAAGFAKALDRFRGFGKPVVPIRSTVGKDFNDQLKGTGQ